MKEILEIDVELFHFIGINLTPPTYGVVKNNFHNVMDPMPSSDLYTEPGPSNPEQYFTT